MDSNQMGHFLYTLRKEKNLTQKDIALMCNLSTQAVSKWERGESTPDIETLEKLSILYNISINELINGEKREIHIDVEKRKQIIGITFSGLVFLAYLFSFLSLPSELGTRVIVKGFAVIFNGTGGSIIVFSWLVFLILISYLVLGIFELSKVTKPGRFTRFYYLFSALFVIFIALIGLLTGFYIVFPQMLIVISVVVIALMHYEKGLFGVVGEWVSSAKVSHDAYKKHLAIYIAKKRSHETVVSYDNPTFQEKRLWHLAFLVFYLLLTLYMILSLISSVVMLIDAWSEGNDTRYIVYFAGLGLLQVGLVIYLVSSILLLKTTLFHHRLVHISLYLGVVILLQLFATLNSTAYYIIFLGTIVIFLLYRKFLSEPLREQPKA